MLVVVGTYLLTCPALVPHETLEAEIRGLPSVGTADWRGGRHDGGYEGERTV